MRFTQSFVKTSAKMMIIAGLAIGVSGSVFASGGTSIVSGLNNQAAIGNTQGTVQSMKQDGGGDKAKGGSGGNGGSKTTGGMDGGNGGPPGCVPEPCSMLALGVGAGMIALKVRKNKSA